MFSLDNLFAEFVLSQQLVSHHVSYIASVATGSQWQDKYQFHQTINKDTNKCDYHLVSVGICSEQQDVQIFFSAKGQINSHHNRESTFNWLFKPH